MAEVIANVAPSPEHHRWLRWAVPLWGLVAALNVASLLLPFEEGELVWEVQWDVALDLWEEVLEFAVEDRDWQAISIGSVADAVVFVGPQVLFWIGLGLGLCGWPARWTAPVLLLLNALGFTGLLLVYAIVYDSGIADVLNKLWSQARIGFWLWWTSLWATAAVAIYLYRRTGPVDRRREEQETEAPQTPSAAQ